MDVPEKLKAYMKTTPIANQVDLDNRMSAREKAKARQKAQKLADQEFFERTGIRDESEDFNLENLVNQYEYDMAKMEQEDKKKMREKRKKAFKDMNNIDPETGRPFPGPQSFSDIDSEEFENDFEEVSRDNPQFATKEF